MVSKNESFLRRLTGPLRTGESDPADRAMRRLEDKRRALSEATDQWLSLLREMESSGQSSDAKYESYYQAYLKAKEQQKRADLELFNLRQGLSR